MNASTWGATESLPMMNEERQGTSAVYVVRSMKYLRNRVECTTKQRKKRNWRSRCWSIPPSLCNRLQYKGSPQVKARLLNSSSVFKYRPDFTILLGSFITQVGHWSFTFFVDCASTVQHWRAALLRDVRCSSINHCWGAARWLSRAQGQKTKFKKKNAWDGGRVGKDDGVVFTPVSSLCSSRTGAMQLVIFGVGVHGKATRQGRRPHSENRNTPVWRSPDKAGLYSPHELHVSRPSSGVVSTRQFMRKL